VQAEGRVGWLVSVVTFPQFKVCCFSHTGANQLQNEMMTMLQCGSRVLLAVTVTLIMVLVVCTFAMRLPHLRQQLLCALCSLPHNRQECPCKGLSLCPLPSGRPSQSHCKSSTAVKKQSPHQSSGTSVLSLASKFTPTSSLSVSL